jgi:hypothetical protein
MYVRHMSASGYFITYFPTYLGYPVVNRVKLSRILGELPPKTGTGTV